MDTASYSFSACSDGSASYTITCTGPDCDTLGDLFGSICSSSGDTVTCSYNNCTGPADYLSTSQISVSNSTFYAVNDLSINDGADVSFVVNRTGVLPLVTSSNSQNSTASATFTTSASLVSTSTNSASSSSTSCGSLSGLASPSGISSGQGATTTHSSTSTTTTQPNGEFSQSTTGSSMITSQTTLSLSSSSSKAGVSATVESASTTSETLTTHSSFTTSQSTFISSSTTPRNLTTSGISQIFNPPNSSSVSKPISSSSLLNIAAPLPSCHTSEISTSNSVILPPATSPSSAPTSHRFTNSYSLSPAATQSSSGSAPTDLSLLPPGESSASFTEAYIAVQQSKGPSDTTDPVIPPLASAQTVTAGSTSSSLATSAVGIKIQQSSGASRSTRGSTSLASFLTILLLLLFVMTPTVTASGLYSNPIADLQSSAPFHEPRNAIPPSPINRKALITPGSFVGPAIGDASTWVKQFTNFFCDNEPSLSSDLITLGTDILDLVCQVVLSDLETDINREIQFKQGWQ
ncbi:hypothetical protein N431DRAFT_464050 [Stipitochalara longipes BDJ]|nr:hypothetical protein N431DRAFT_464050 [Stipitochalara longipes BDJ]